MKPLHAWILWPCIAGVLGLIGVGMHRHMPLSLPQCDNYHPKETYDPDHQECAMFDRFILIPVRVGLHAIGETVHEYRDDLIVWETLAIA